MRGKGGGELRVGEIERRFEHSIGVVDLLQDEKGSVAVGNGGDALLGKL
jgi:hypothetical protein